MPSATILSLKRKYQRKLVASQLSIRIRPSGSGFLHCVQSAAQSSLRSLCAIICTYNASHWAELRSAAQTPQSFLLRCLRNILCESIVEGYPSDISE